MLEFKRHPLPPPPSPHQRPPIPYIPDRFSPSTPECPSSRPPCRLDRFSPSTPECPSCRPPWILDRFSPSTPECPSSRPPIGFGFGPRLQPAGGDTSKQNHWSLKQIGLWGCGVGVKHVFCTHSMTDITRTTVGNHRNHRNHKELES